jgi:hypothetical protein
MEGQPGGVPTDVILRLNGPNDGEPINSRIVPLKLSTDYEEYASISIYVNSVYLYSRSLQGGAYRDPDSGLLVSNIDLDIQAVRKRLGEDAFDPDASPLTVSVHLHNARTGILITHADWRGCVGKPWLEFLDEDALGEGGDGETQNQDLFALKARLPILQDPPAGKAPAIIHKLKTDTYIFVFVSHDEALLKTSPEDANILLESKLVYGNSCDPGAAYSLARNLVFVDSSLSVQPEPEKTVFAVVWSYDPTTGWKRSAVVPVPQDG